MHSLYIYIPVTENREVEADNQEFKVILWDTVGSSPDSDTEDPVFKKRITNWSCNNCGNKKEPTWGFVEGNLEW